MLDLKITGGTIVDGTGRPGFRGDVGIRDGRIVAVGKVEESARATVAAAGRVVSPGFIDVHTHYDAQVFWEPTLSPSCYHGVTTVFGGFCGFSIAPLTPEAAEYIKPMLARVEGMPLKTLAEAVPWDWRSFGEFLAKMEGRVGLNAGFFAGHSAIRRVVMGKRAVGEKATADDLAKMQSLLDRSLSEGAVGFSTTVSVTHTDGDGQPVPSRWADHSEIIELGRVVSKHEGAGLEILPDVMFGPETLDLLTEFSLAGNCPVNWNVMIARSDPVTMARVEKQLAASDYARARGAEVIALAIPSGVGVYMNFNSGQSFDHIPGVWKQVFKLPVAERIAKFKDPEFRKIMARDAAEMPENAPLKVFARLGDYTVVSVGAAQNKRYEGRKVKDIAAEQGREALEVMLDIAVEDNLRTIFAPEMGGEDPASYQIRGRLFADDRVLVGASDAGAHLDLIDTFAFSTTLLQRGVREHKVISLEQAVHKMTQRPARYYGLVDRGVIAPGQIADIVVFEAATVGRGATYYRYDLPGGEDFRLYADAQGIDHVFVNGVEIVRAGKHTGALPGTVLRSGRDTRRVAMDVMRQA